MNSSVSGAFSQAEVSSKVQNLVGHRATKLSVRGRHLSACLDKDYSRSAVSGQSESPGSPWFELLEEGVSRYRVGAEVLDFCLSNLSTRAFVFFSLKDRRVLDLVSFLLEQPDVQIVYATNLELTRIGSLNLIELCYGDKPFFTEQIRQKMARERFGYSSNAFVVVYTLNQKSKDARSLKEDLRRTLPPLTFERRIHGTDAPEDTRILVEAISNPNTMHLLNGVKVSRKDRVFSRVPALFRNNPNVCLDGSSVMELYGLRKSRDLDIISIDPILRSAIMSMGFDLNDRHYEWLPIDQNKVIQDPHLHLILFGVKFTSLAVRQLILTLGPSYGGEKLSSKKSRDLHLISQFNAGTGKKLFNLNGFVGTLFTQLRLLFEFVVVKIIPFLPPGLVKVLRQSRAILLRR
jgi:hypothetical protein